MKCFAIIFLLLTNVLFSQENARENIFKPEFKIAATTTFYFGDNYLSKGHANPAFGATIQLNLFEYQNFKLGGMLQKSTLKVSEYSLGGNIERSNINQVKANVAYKIDLKKFIIMPEICYGGIEINQKTEKKRYGTQKGKTIGFGLNTNYKLSNMVEIYNNISYDYLLLNINTTPEYANYFDKGNAINISLGFSFN